LAAENAWRPEACITFSATKRFTASAAAIVATPKTHRIVQLTDFHLGSTSDHRYRGVNPFASLTQTLSHLKAQSAQPDRYLLTGDLAEAPCSATYDLVAQAFEGHTAPIHFVPGNHDVPALMSSHLQPVGFHDDPVIRWGNWCILLMNSAQPESPKGKLGPHACQWLSDTLNGMQEQWIVIAVHHHPIASGSAWMDTMMIEDQDVFLKIIQRHPQVKAVLFGHVHQELDVMWSDIRFLGAPSTCVQFEPQSKTFATTDAYPGYRWIELDEEGRLSTRVVRIGPKD
jgi:Icc protein